MEKKVIPYANGCSLAVNSDKTEAVITFFQSQPGFNQETIQLDIHGAVEVASIVIPFNLLEQVQSLIEQCAGTEDDTHKE